MPTAVSMKVQFLARSGLPPLAWCAIVRNDRKSVDVLHGSSVEVRDDRFFEAAWDGPFDRFDPASFSVVCGTGGVIDGDRCCFTASTDRLSPLFSVRTPAGLFVSNSPVFALAQADETPDPAYPFYLYALLRIWQQGLACPSGPLPLLSGRQLRVHFVTLVTVGPNEAETFAPHPPGEAPHDYASYRRLLERGIDAVLKNAADPRRVVPLRSSATVSSGYDSTATATLAAAAGCQEAISFFDPAEPGPSGDSGKENAARLGMTCTEYPRWGFLDAPGCPEVEFAIVGTAMPVPFVQVEDRLSNRILVMGTFGDRVWNPAKIARAEGFSLPRMQAMSGLAPIEFRLRVGYLPFAPIAIGARHNHAIARLLEDEELKPWSVGGKYDRPFPRRIAEEAGLPRESFGVRKAAAAHTHFGHPGITTPGTVEDYGRFFAERRARVAAPVRAWWRARVLARHARWAPYRHHGPIRLPPRYLFGFQWSVARLRERYLP